MSALTVLAGSSSADEEFATKAPLLAPLKLQRLNF